MENYLKFSDQKFGKPKTNVTTTNFYPTNIKTPSITSYKHYRLTPYMSKEKKKGDFIDP